MDRAAELRALGTRLGSLARTVDLRSQELAIKILSSMFSWLVQAQYLIANPWMLLKNVGWAMTPRSTTIRPRARSRRPHGLP